MNQIPAWKASFWFKTLNEAISKVEGCEGTPSPVNQALGQLCALRTSMMDEFVSDVTAEPVEADVARPELQIARAA